MRSISFNPAMLAAVRAGRKTVTRRRLPTHLPMQQEPDRYRFVGLSAPGALFEDLHARPPALLPPLPLPFGPPGTRLSIQEAPEIHLEITSVRAEQVRCLTAADAVAEGIGHRATGQLRWGGVVPNAARPGTFRWYRSSVEAFQGLLDAIYPTAWTRNEWVWVSEFAVVPTVA